jgi:hypothetical protein
MSGRAVGKRTLLNSGTRCLNPCLGARPMFATARAWDLVRATPDGERTTEPNQKGAIGKETGFERGNYNSPSVRRTDWQRAAWMPGRSIPDSSDLSLLRAKNGLDKGVHFTPSPPKSSSWKP